MNETRVQADPTSIEELKSLVGRPSLENLSYALRHPDTWPQGFVWDFTDCRRCAMGLAHELWAQIPRTNRVNAPSLMAREFALPYAAAQSIFLGSMTWLPKKQVSKGHLWWKQDWEQANHAAVTPEMVADQIDKYLARAE